MVTSSVKWNLNKNLMTYVKIPWNFDEIHPIFLAYAEQEINMIKWTNVFSGFKTNFARPGHTILY